MANRVEFVQINGREVLSIDFSNCTSEECIAVIEQAKNLIRTRPLGTVRTLTNVENAHYNPEATRALKEYVAHNKPYVKAGAVVGLDGMKTFIFNFMNRVTGRSLQAMDDIESAKAWLTRD